MGRFEFIRIFQRTMLVGALLVAAIARATIGASFQLQLGNPSNATNDPTNHTHYLVQRAQYALDYSDTTREPNWVSWNLTAADVGGSGRSDFAVDPDLPAGFRRVLTTDYVGSGYDRGHMCPSADRTVTVADNQATFYMSNMLPQAPDNNQGVWASFETYCRTLASAGNELLILSGPSGFGGMTAASGVAIPGFTWKIAVIVPVGPGTATSRITTSTRVIALNIPNVQGIRSNPWQNFVTSAAQIEADTGLTFFTTLAPAVAAALRARVDGQSAAGAPTLTMQPVAQSAPEGGSATFSVTANGDPPLSYQWLKDDVEITAATNPTLSLSDVQARDAGSYTVVVTNLEGSVASNAARLSVRTASPGIAAYWNFDLPGPTTLPGESSASELTQHNNNGTTPLLTSTSASSGYSGASGGNNAGAAARIGALNLAAGGSAFFEFTLQALAARQLVVSALAFGSRSTSTGPRAYAIFSSADNFSAPIASGTLANDSIWRLVTATLASPITGPTGGALTFRVHGYDGAGSAAANTANWRIDDLSVAATALAPPPVRLANLSTRARAGTGSESAIGGFVIVGDEAKTLLIRAAGPTLASFGLSNLLAAPRLELMRGSTLIASNVGWSTASNAAAIATAASRTGAFPFPMTSADSALLVTVVPGSYTAIVSSANGPPGVALAEIYDVPDPGSGAASALVNLSTRAFTGNGDDTLIAGLVIEGTAPKRVLLRAAGPALAAFGVTGPLSRPQLIVRDSLGGMAGTNNGWSTSPDAAMIAVAAQRVGAFPFAAGSADSALLVTLPPGNYTAQVVGFDGGMGIALVEVYDAP